MNFSEEHFGFIENIFKLNLVFSGGVLGFVDPHFRFKRNLNMMQHKTS